MNPGTGIAALKNSTFPGLKIERDLGHPFILGWSDLGHSPKVRALPGAQMRGTWGTHPQWLCAQLPRHLGHPPVRTGQGARPLPRRNRRPTVEACAHPPFARKKAKDGAPSFVGNALPWHPALLGMLYRGASMRTNRTSWLSISMGCLSVRVIGWPVQRSLPVCGPWRPSLTRLRWKGWVE